MKIAVILICALLGGALLMSLFPKTTPPVEIVNTVLEPAGETSLTIPPPPPAPEPVPLTENPRTNQEDMEETVIDQADPILPAGVVVQ